MAECLDYVLPKNPVTGNREIHIIPESVEVSLGGYLYPTMVSSSGGELYDPKYDGLVKKIGAAISQVSDRKKLPFKFTVIDSNVLNAWCLPGGKIAFNRGLIERMEKETDEFGVGKFTIEEKIAAVLSHEITHATARHSAKTLEFGAFLLVVCKVIQIAIYRAISRPTGRDTDEDRYKRRVQADALDKLFDYVFKLFMALVTSHGSRQHEREADRYGMAYLKRAGYNPRVAVWLQEFFAKQHPSQNNSILSWFATHPDSKERAKLNRDTLNDLERGVLA